METGEKVVDFKVNEERMDSVATTTTKFFPHALVVEILTWLPISRLWPLRYVNKAWFKLLTKDQLFAKLHFDRSVDSNVSPSLLTLRTQLDLEKINFYLATDYTACDEAIDLELPFYKGNNLYTVRGISNGLICISLSHLYEQEVYIWNPIIKDHITIPCSPMASHVKATEFAFGFHQDINEYKVIKFVTEANYIKWDFHSHVSVCTLGEDLSWRTVEQDTEYNVSFMFEICPVINGFLHWIAMKAGASRLTVLLSFDLKDEVFREIAHPNDVDFSDRGVLTRIGELSGCLSIFRCTCEENVQIWLMEEYGAVSSWRKLFIIGRPEVGVSFAFSQPIGLVARNVEIVLKINSGELILYNPKTNLVTKPKEFGFEIFRAYMYVGSIVSPRVICEAQ